MRSEIRFPKQSTRKHFFSRGKLCLSTSALAKPYGVRFHFNSEGILALYGMETEMYQKLMGNSGHKGLKAMINRKVSKK